MTRGNTSAQAQVHLRSGCAAGQLVYRGEFGAKGFLTKGAKNLRSVNSTEVRDACEDVVGK